MNDLNITILAWNEGRSEDVLNGVFCQSYPNWNIYVIGSDGKDTDKVRYTRRSFSECLKEIPDKQYVYLLRYHSVLDKRLFEKMTKRINETGAEVCAADVYRQDQNGGNGADALRYEFFKGRSVFENKDYPEESMKIIRPGYDDLLVRADVLKQCEDYLDDEILLPAVLPLFASKIASVRERLVTHIGERPHYTADQLIHAVEQGRRYTDNERTFEKFTVQTLISFFSDGFHRDAEGFAELYSYAHKLFRSFEGAEERNRNQIFRIIHHHDLNEITGLLDKKLFVSFTSYPARISYAAKVIETLLKQKHQADGIELYLAEEQFPNKEEDLPEELRRYREDGKIEICWCDDLQSHKKYFYSFQKHRDDIVVTVDDDVKYEEDVLEKLYLSYLEYPNAVSGLRTHLMTMEGEKILPYSCWLKNTNVCIREECPELMATGAGAVLYPVSLFPDELYDKDTIKETCIRGDDLWLKVMEIHMGIPTVMADKARDLITFEGSQSTSLWQENITQNDVQMKKILEHFSKVYGEKYIERKLTGSDRGRRLLDWKDILPEVNRTYQELYGNLSHNKKLLKKAYEEKSELNRKLQQTYKEKSERGEEIRRLKEIIKDYEEKEKKRAGKGLLGKFKI